MDYTPVDRIKTGMCIAMMITSVICYILSFIPVVDWIEGLLSPILFFCWFKLLNANYFRLGKSKHGGIWGSPVLQGVSFILGMLPFVITGIISAFPIVMYMNIRRVRAEDKARNAELKAEADARADARQQAYAEEMYLMRLQLDQQDEEAEQEETMTPQTRWEDATPQRNVLRIQPRIQRQRPMGNKRAA
jgi:hypothetical protein